MSDDVKVGAGQGGSRPVLDSYARLSRMPETGELEKIETQWDDNLTKIKRVGGVLGVQEKDGLSAWKRGVKRPGWERLLERVRSGESDGVVVWHTDRLFRQPRDLETLIDLASEGFRVYSAHGSRDLSNADDRFILRIEVAQAAKSSDDTSRRIKRRFAAKRADGVAYLGGPRWFGWPGGDATWTAGDGQGSEDRPMVSDELVAREREAIRAAASAMLKEISGAQVMREWNESGLLTSQGRGWVWPTFREVMMRATNAGLIETDGVLVGRIPGDPILDPEVFDRLRALFAGRRRGRVAGQSYLGTGIVRCGECGNKLTSHKEGSKRYKDGTARASYYCSKDRRGCGRVFADVRMVDAELEALTVRRLSDSSHAEAIAAAQAKVSARLGEVQAEIGQCVKIQKGLSDRLGRREMDLDAFDAANLPLVKDLVRLRAEREQLEGGSPHGPKKAQSADTVRAEWADANNAEKRAMLISALGSNVLYVDRFAHHGKRTFDPDRMRLGVSGEHRNTNPPA